MDLKGAEIRNFENLCNDMSTKKELPLRVNIPFIKDLIGGMKLGLAH